MLTIALFFIGHWLISVFFQTFFLHRYSAHRQFSMSPRWEKIFYFATWFTQGSSYLEPRAYALLHREHHAYSDTERDPHSPHIHHNVVSMMWATKIRYFALADGTIQPEARFDTGTPKWEAIDRLGAMWTVRIGFGVAYTAFYVAFAPSLIYFALLPFHFLMGPIHGAIVNWCGHRYGYRNFESNDFSRNTLPFDFVTLGELFQNNHHKAGMSPNFAARWFEIDPAYWVIRAMAWLGIVELSPDATAPAHI